MFSIKQLDLNLSQQELQSFENPSKTYVFMSKMDFD